MKEKGRARSPTGRDKREERPFPLCPSSPPPPPPRVHSIFRLYLLFLLGHPVGVSKEERVPEELTPIWAPTLENSRSDSG